MPVGKIGEASSPYMSSSSEDSDTPTHTGTREQLSLGNRTLALGGVLIAIFVLLVALVPVTFTSPTGPTPDGVSSGSWERVGLPTPTTVKISQRGPGVTNLSVSLQPPEVFREDLITKNRNFEFDAANGAYVARGPANMTLQGVFGDVSVALNAGTTADDVRIERLGPGGAIDEQTLSPSSTSPWVATTVESPREKFHFTVPLLRALTIGDAWNSPDMSADVAGQPVSAEDLASRGATVLLVAGIIAVAGGAFMFALAIAILLFFWLVGRAADFSDDASSAREAVRVLFGAGMVAAVLNTLAYFVPVWLGVLLVIGMCLTGIVFRVLRRRPHALGKSLGLLSGSLLWAGIPALVAFFPAAFWGTRFLGAYRTDLFQYEMLASVVHDHSLLEMQNLPLAQDSGSGVTADAGFIWRSIDSVLAGGVGHVTGVGISGGFALLGLVLFFLFALAAFGLVDLQRGETWHKILVVILLLNPLFSGLMIENYFSHYFFVALVPGLVLASALLFRGKSDPPDSPRVPAERGGRRGGQIFVELAIAAILATMLAAYPYFCVVLLVGFIPAIVIKRDRLRIAIRRGPIILVEALVLANLALLTVFHYRETEVYQEGLNAIAKNVLLVPYDPPQLLSLLAGFHPYQWRSWDAPAQQWMGTVGRRVWEAGVPATSPGLLEIIAALLLVVSVVVGIRWMRSMRSFAFLSLVGVTLVWMAFTGYLVMEGSTYAALKTSWTGAAISPLVLVAAAWRARWLPYAVALFALAGVLWLRTGVVDRVDWILPRDTPVLSARYHSSVEPEVAAIADALRGVSGEVDVVVGPQPIQGSDRDVVARAQAWVALRDLGIECPGCRPDPAEVGCRVGVSAVVLIGVSGREEYCGMGLVFRGSVVEIYR